MKKNFLTPLFLLLTAFLLLLSAELMAQPFNLTESVQPVELNLSEYKKDGNDKAMGRISMNTLSQDRDTMYYFVKGLSIYSPTYFSINSADPNTDIKVNLCKENWHSFNQTGEIKGKEIWKSRFKTESDFGIMVIARKKPARYVLLVWTGEEMKIEMPAVFKPATAADLGGSGWLGRNKLMVIIIAAVAIIVSFLAWKRKQKSNTLKIKITGMKKMILLLLTALLSIATNAQEPDQNDPVIQANEDQHNGNDDQEQDEASDREAIDGAIQNLQDYMAWLEDRRNEWNDIANFSPTDCAPDFGASGAAMMPSTCASNQACSECYERAVGELNFIRRQLGRLSCIYNNTKRFNQSAIAFGDNMSGIHAVTGAAWQSARGEIVGQYESFKHTYDSKYADMIGSLQRALHVLASI